MLNAPREFEIAGRKVGAAHPPFVIAEMSGNHNGDLDRALAIVDAIAESGAHALKLQTYTADTMTIDHDGPEFRMSDDHPLWGGRNLYSLYIEAYTPWEWHAPLFARAREKGLIAFSTPFDGTAIDLLESLDVPAYKVGSFEINDIPLIRAIAKTGKPIILSSGTASAEDVDLAVATVRAEGNEQIAVLGCTSNYPASPAGTDLRAIETLAHTWDVVGGISDHTKGIGVSVAAVAFGAAIVEKHVTLRREDGGIDSDFSLEPAELKALVDETEAAWLALGTGKIGAKSEEKESLRFRRSIFITADAKAGDLVTTDNVRCIRPVGGLEPRYWDVVLGRRFTQDVKFGQPLTWDVI